MKKKISIMLMVLAIVAGAEEIGLKLQGSGACIKSCTKYAMGLAVVGNDRLGEHMRGTDKETKLAGSELACVRLIYHFQQQPIPWHTLCKT